MGTKGDIVDGVMLLDKPEGMSSNWALQLVRRLINAQKAGHTGTLDPMATGLLPLAFGKATKYSADLLKADKRYTATLLFGRATDTMDKSGQTIASSDVIPTLEAIEAVLPRFTGEIEQLPPMYSAIKHEGRNLYDLARHGIEIERQARRVTVYTLKILDYKEGLLTIDVKVSKGTYIRVLADDMGKALGTYAHLVSLKRTEVGDLKLADAVPFSVIDDKALTIQERRAYLKGADFLLQTLPALDLDDTHSKRLQLGQRFKVQGLGAALYRAYGPNKRLLGVVEVDSKAVIHPKRLIQFYGTPV